MTSHAAHTPAGWPSRSYLGSPARSVSGHECSARAFPSLGATGRIAHRERHPGSLLLSAWMPPLRLSHPAPIPAARGVFLQGIGATGSFRCCERERARPGVLQKAEVPHYERH